MNFKHARFIRIRFAFSLLATAPLFLSHVLAAQIPPRTPQQYSLVVTRDPEAVKLLRQCWVAMGSPDPTLPFRAEASTTPLARGGSPAQVTMETYGPNRMRMDTSREGTVRIFMVADGLGFMSGDKSHSPYSYTATRYPNPQWLPYSLCSAALKSKDMTVAYLGHEVISDVVTNHIQVYVKMVDSKQNVDELERRQSQVDIFLNHGTSLPTRAQSFSFGMHDATNSLLWTTDYTSYAPVEGIMLPARTVEWLSHQKVRQYDWTSIVVNAPIDSGTFSIGK
jgi:hypothetical protein